MAAVKVSSRLVRSFVVKLLTTIMCATVLNAELLETGKPIGFGILTTENEEQAYDRVGGNHGHKGEEAAQVVLEMVGLLKALEKLKK